MAISVCAVHAFKNFQNLHTFIKKSKVPHLTVWLQIVVAWSLWCCLSLTGNKVLAVIQACQDAFFKAVATSYSQLCKLY